MAKVEESIVDENGHGVMLSAVRGEGAFMRRMVGSAQLEPVTRIPSLGAGSMDLKDLRIVESAKGNAWRRERLRDIAARIGAVYPGIDLYSSHMRYVALVLGGGDVQLRIPGPPGGAGGTKKGQMNVWDHAGLQLLVAEAGGMVTDLNGEDIDFGKGRELGNFGVLAARKRVHGEVLRVVREALEGTFKS